MVVAGLVVVVVVVAVVLVVAVVVDRVVGYCSGDTFFGGVKGGGFSNFVFVLYLLYKDELHIHLCITSTNNTYYNKFIFVLDILYKN